MMKIESPFLDTMFRLRNDECITIFTDIQKISKKEEQDLADYLESEFEKERLEFLSDKINYNSEAAVWAAKVLYHSAQLYLIRKDTAKDLEKLIPQFKTTYEISSFLSADLSLRFLSQIILTLQSADTEDPLIKILESILTQFHYSGIGFELDLEKNQLERGTKRRYIQKIIP